jgi:prophage regulatory protein
MRLIRINEVKAKTGLCTTAIYEGMRDNWFPKSIPLSKQARGWDDDEIDGWIKAKIAAARSTEVA